MYPKLYQISTGSRRLPRGIQYVEVLDVYGFTVDAQLKNLDLGVAVEYLPGSQELCQQPKSSKSQGRSYRKQHDRAGIYNRSDDNRGNARIGKIVRRFVPSNIGSVMDLFEQIGGRFACPNTRKQRNQGARTCAEHGRFIARLARIDVQRKGFTQRVI